MSSDITGVSSAAHTVQAMPVLPAAAFINQLADSCHAITNRLDREWPATLPEPHMARVVLRALVLAAGNAFATIRYVCAEHPEDNSRKIEYSLTLPPLSRVILEGIFTTIFLFDDLQNRVGWFVRAGWRDNREEYELLKDTFGADPQWKSYLGEFEKMTDRLADDIGVSIEARNNPSEVVDWWPTPGRMIRTDGIDPARRRRMEYLNTWFYGQLSSSAHLKWPGLVRSAAALLERNHDENIRALLRKSRSDVVAVSAVMLVALLSEIEVELGYGHAEQLMYVWTVLADTFGFARSLYESHYRSRLRPT
jgi:hypothetical protein